MTANDLSYWTKITAKNSFSDLAWNIPEQKTGIINLIGGNSGGFASVAHSADFLNSRFPIKQLNILLPDVLKNKVPLLPGLEFLPSTASGSFAKSPLLNEYLATADYSIFIGDLSKNSATCVALAESIKTASPSLTSSSISASPSLTSSSTTTSSDRPVLLTRDAIDLLVPEMPSLIERQNLTLVGSLAQIQKIFRAVYYPKMLMLSMPLLPAIEALHKFTLSYPATIVTFHQEQIIIAYSGKIATIPLEKSTYSPLSLWAGDLACKIAMNDFYSPGDPLKSSVFSVNML